MKTAQKMLLKIASAATALVLSTSVNAALFSSASVSIDWNNIEVYSNFLVEGPNDLIPRSQYTLTYNAPRANTSAQSPYFGAIVQSSTAYMSSEGGAVATVSALNDGITSVTALASNGFASSNASFGASVNTPSAEVTLNFANPGHYTLFLPYTIFVEITGLADPNEFGNAQAEIYINALGLDFQQVFSTKTGDIQSPYDNDKNKMITTYCPVDQHCQWDAGAQLIYGFPNTQKFGLSIVGDVVDNLLFTGGVRTYVASGFYAPAAVPVPAAAWLLGSGLLGLIGVASRKV